MMAAKALLQVLLIALVRIMTIYPVRASNIPRHSVNADIISLEEYGIVFKPGRLMSTSDVTHIQQGFLIEIPRRERRTDEMTAAEALCDRVSRTIIGITRYYHHVCGILRDSVEWLTLTTKALARQHDKLIIDTLASLPSDDRHWVKPRRNKLRNRQRYRREKEKEKEEEIEDITSYHVFGLGWSSDVKYNRKLIRVLNKAVDDNQEVLYEFMNRTDIALDQIHKFVDSVMVMEANFLSLSSSVEKTFIEVRQAQKTAVLYQTLLPMVLEEELGRVIYLQDLLMRTQAFRKGVQYLLRGQLAMDLVPPEAQAIREVNGYLKSNYRRFEAAFHSPAFYYDNSKPMFTFKDNELIVYVRIPVVSGEHLFRVYEVLSFPVPINMGNHAQKDALQIVNL